MRIHRNQGHDEPVLAEAAPVTHDNLADLPDETTVDEHFVHT